MTVRGSEIVVGIDFGTTHSGVSWAVNGGTKNIRLINNWRDPEALNASKEKVPSLITYMNGKPQRWGYDVGLNDEPFKWIKILLEENHKYTTIVQPVQTSDTLLRKVHKTAQDVVADYLKLLWEYTIEDIRKFYPDYEDLFNLRVVLTVPAMWSPAAKDKTSGAAKLAGMPDTIKLVTEPEAAALATLRDKSEENQLKVGDAFVVCDAGGGTVDVISYEIQNLIPLKIKECAIGSGELCGSAFLDVAFIKYIETRVGIDQYDSVKERYRNAMMRKFEFGIKRAFSGKDDHDFSVELIGIKDDPKNDIIDETIKIKPAALEACFDHVAQQIQTLVAEQIADVKEHCLNVKAVILVGGFGESKFIYNRLKACHEPKGIQVLQVNGAWSSVCRGATLWGLEHPNESITPSSLLSNASTFTANEPTVTSRISRYSYGLSFSVPYNERRHLIHDAYKDEKTGLTMAKQQMTWLLKRGEGIENGRVLRTEALRTIEVGFFASGEMLFSSNLWYCEEPKPPARQTEAVKPLCTVTYGVDRNKLWREKSFKGPDKRKHRNATFQLVIILDNASLEFVVGYRDELVGHVEAQYKQSFT